MKPITAVRTLAVLPSQKQHEIACVFGSEGETREPERSWKTLGNAMRTGRFTELVRLLEPGASFDEDLS